MTDFYDTTDFRGAGRVSCAYADQVAERDETAEILSSLGYIDLISSKGDPLRRDFPRGLEAFDID